MPNESKPTVKISFAFSATETRGYQTDTLLSYRLAEETVPEGATVIEHLAHRLAAEFVRLTGREL